MKPNISRRDFLKAGSFTLLGTSAAAIMNGAAFSQQPPPEPAHTPDHRGHADAMAMAVGEVNHAVNGFNPSDALTEFDYGKVSTLDDGRTLREYDIYAINKDIEIMPGMIYSAWTYNGRVPGPTLRCSEGDRLRINFRNGSSHPHSLHFHGVHTAEMDGVPGTPGVINPGESFTYEFDAEPFGVHLYHCHIMPLATHISRGLYGAFIVEPPGGWPQADRELVMVLNGFDLDFDMANDVYAVNTIPFHYDRHPIAIKVGELVRIFLVNILEFDPINSFHLHANLFHYYPTGTSLTPSEYTDMIAQMQAQRGMLEFRYKFPGKYMFHAHKTEFAELGWTGNFQVEA